MQTITTFDFATVVCDGCGHKADTHSFDDAVMRSYEDFIDWYLEDSGWERVNEDNDDKWFCPVCAKDPSKRTNPGHGSCTAKTIPLYGLRCDNCGKEWEDSSEGWTSCEKPSSVEEYAWNEEWNKLGGRWYCDDCLRTCDPMQDWNEEEDWEEKYCSKCEYKGDCHEKVPRETPRASNECKTAIHDRASGTWNKCPHLSKTQYGFWQCDIAQEPNCKDRCPRVCDWRDKGRTEQEAANAAALAKCKKAQS